MRARVGGECSVLPERWTQFQRAEAAVSDVYGDVWSERGRRHGSPPRRIDSPRNTVGGQGKSGEKPARSRHCDRVKEVAGARAAPATGDATESPGRRGRPTPEARRPVPGQPMTTLEERVASMPRLVPFRLAAACALALLLLVSTARGRLGEEGRSRPARRRPRRQGARRRDAEDGHDQRSRPARRPTASARAPAAAARRRRSPGPTALGLLGQAAKLDRVAEAAADHRRLRLRPRALRGRRLQRHGQGILVPEGQPQEPGTRRRAGQAEAGRRSALGAGAKYPYPKELALEAPGRSDRRACRSRSASSPTTTRASASRVKGALVTGGAGPTDAEGRTTVTLAGPTRDPRDPRQGHPVQRGRRSASSAACPEATS